MSTTYGIFFNDVHLPVLAILAALVWGFIVIRVLGVRRCNAEYRSRWLTTSACCISVTGVLVTVHFALWIGITVLNERLHKIAERHGIYDDYRGTGELPDGQSPTPATFTSEEIGVMAYYQNVLFVLIDTGRFLLAVALWMTKLAFSTSLLASSYCLKRPQEVSLYAVSGVLITCFAIVLWISSTPLPYDNIAYTPEEVIDGMMWRGIISDYYTRHWLEYLLTGLNISTDVLLAAVGFYIIRSLPIPSRATSLLVTMFVITIAVAITRLVVVIKLLDLSDKITAGSNVTILGGGVMEQLGIVSLVMTELEVLLSAIVSCLPAIRARVRMLTKVRLPGESENPGIDGNSIGGVPWAAEGEKSVDGVNFVTFKTQRRQSLSSNGIRSFGAR